MGQCPQVKDTNNNGSSEGSFVAERFLNPYTAILMGNAGVLVLEGFYLEEVLIGWGHSISYSLK